MTTRSRLNAELATRRYTRRHAREIVTAMLGNNSGTVIASTDTRWYWIRLHGDPNQVVRAWNTGFVAPVPDLPVDVEIVKSSGITDYQVVGVSLNKGIAADVNAGATGIHALQHQRRDFNTGGFDPLDIYGRAIVQLRARAQATPDMTLYVEPGWFSVSGIATYFAGGNSPAFTAPVGGSRCDLLYLDNAGTLQIVTGTVVPLGTPLRPVQPTVDDLPLAYVYLTAATTSITEYIIEDGRMVFGGAGGGVGAHNILSATHSDTTVAAPADDDVLTWDAASGTWRAEPSASDVSKATDNVSNPPTEAQEETAFDVPATWARRIGHLDDNALHQNEYLSLSDDDAFWIALLAKARLAATSATSSNAAAAQTTPTYDGSGQAMHPAVLYFPDSWNGKKYWMAMTPLPGGDSTKENPSILCCDDGTTWAVPVGLTNPIEPDPGGGTYNSDADLVYNPSDGKLYCTWRYTDNATVDTLYFRNSSDGVTWANKTQIIPSGAFMAQVSPSIIWDGTQFVMWYVTYAGGGVSTLYQRTCATMGGVWSAATACTLNGLPAGKFLWHLSVAKRGAKYHGFLVLENTVGGLHTLWFAESSDGLTWQIAAALLLQGSGGANWDAQQVYRAYGVPTPTGYDFWYSGRTAASVWHIGRTTVVLDNLLLANLSRLISFRDTQANVESFGGTLEEQSIAYATDTGELGVYSGGRWNWIAPMIVHALGGAFHTGNLTQARSHDSPDTDVAPASLHHTLGAGANQAAAGNHTHAGDRLAPLVAEAIAWDDIRVAGTMVRPGATAPALSAFGPSGNLKVLFFEEGHHDEVHFEIQMPHGWKEGTYIYPHVHWTPVTTEAGNVVWELEYSWKNINATFAAPNTMTSDATAAGGTAWVHHMTDLKDGGGNNYIDGSGQTMSSMIVCRLHRNAGAGSDTLTEAVAFLEFDIHYKIDGLGSDAEDTKSADTRMELVFADSDLVMCEI